MTEGFLNMNKMIQSSLEASTSQVAKTLASNLNQNMPVSVPRIIHGGEGKTQMVAPSKSPAIRVPLEKIRERDHCPVIKRTLPCYHRKRK